MEWKYVVLCLLFSCSLLSAQDESQDSTFRHQFQFSVVMSNFNELQLDDVIFYPASFSYSRRIFRTKPKRELYTVYSFLYDRRDLSDHPCYHNNCTNSILEGGRFTYVAAAYGWKFLWADFRFFRPNIGFGITYMYQHVEEEFETYYVSFTERHLSNRWRQALGAQIQGSVEIPFLKHFFVNPHFNLFLGWAHKNDKSISLTYVDDRPDQSKGIKNYGQAGLGLNVGFRW